jgi:hypothetical protein
MITIIMLIYPVSLVLQLSPYANILNLTPNTKLVSPVFFGNGLVFPKLFGQQIEIGDKMNASFEINATQNDFEGALLLKLQRYSDNQYNMNTSTTKASENETTHVYMLAAWKVKDSKSFAYMALVKHTKELTWNEDKLGKLYNKNRDLLKEYDNAISDIWLMDNHMVLKTTFNARDLKRTLELSISISEKEKDEYAIRPFCIDLER